MSPSNNSRRALEQSYLHYSIRAVHRDVKSPNILLTDSTNRARAKLGDFGLAKIVRRGKHKYRTKGTYCVSKEEETKSSSVRWKKHMTSSVGTTAWMAPECFDEHARYGPAVDVFAFGMLMYEMILLSPPWKDFSRDDIMEAVRSGDRPMLTDEQRHSAPSEYIQLMCACVAQDAKERPPIGQVHTVLLNDVICIDEQNRSTKRHSRRDITSLRRTSGKSTECEMGSTSAIRISVGERPSRRRVSDGVPPVNEGK